MSALQDVFVSGSFEDVKTRLMSKQTDPTNEKDLEKLFARKDLNFRDVLQLKPITCHNWLRAAIRADNLEVAEDAFGAITKFEQDMLEHIPHPAARRPLFFDSAYQDVLTELWQKSWNLPKRCLDSPCIIALTKLVSLEFDPGYSTPILKSTGNTPLHWHAAGYHHDEYKESHECVKPFVRKFRSIINTENSLGQTALHLATLRGNIKFIEALVTEGADITLTDYKGDRPAPTANSSSEQKRRVLNALKNKPREQPALPGIPPKGDHVWGAKDHRPFWRHFFGADEKTPQCCPVCKIKQLTCDVYADERKISTARNVEWHKAHIVADADAGPADIVNGIVLCSNCNNQCKVKNVLQFAFDNYRSSLVDVVKLLEEKHGPWLRGSGSAVNLAHFVYQHYRTPGADFPVEFYNLLAQHPTKAAGVSYHRSKHFLLESDAPPAQRRRSVSVLSSLYAHLSLELPFV